MRYVIYMAHPVSPSEEEIAAAMDRHVLVGGSPDIDRGRLVKRAIRVNIARALRWLSWLRRSFPETTFIAPWIAGILSGENDSDPAQREAGLVDCCATVERCDGIVLVGGRISSGMRRERDHGIANLANIKESMLEIGVETDRLPPMQFDVFDLTPLGSEPPAGGDYSMPWRSWSSTFMMRPA